jgi:pre-mRNA-splicing factor CDC5/CEF1
MLSEARARLANTQGKKAKRKARERQLDESRRLASLQKRRELKAAGIGFKFRPRKGQINYNTEIPFQVRAPSGFFDVSDEKSVRVDSTFTGKALSELDVKTRSQQETEARKNENKRKKANKDNTNIPNVPAEIQR